MPTTTPSPQPQIQFVPDPVPAAPLLSSTGRETSPSVSLSQVEEDVRSTITTGVPMAPEKTVGPFEVLTFAGIELDCEIFEARLSEDKVVKARETIGNMKGRQKVTLRELQSLIGLLNFECSVTVLWIAFLRRLIYLTIGVKQPPHYIRLTRETTMDSQIWECFLESFNGRSLFLQND